MKHKGIMFTLIAMLLSVMLLPGTGWAKPAVPEHMDAFYVNDFAGVIDLKAENYMVNYGVKLHQETGAQVVLVTVDSTGGASMEEYAKTLLITGESARLIRITVYCCCSRLKMTITGCCRVTD